MNDVVPIEYRQKPLHRPPGVTRSWLNVFAQDAPSVLNGANDRILIGIIHGGTQLRKNRPFKLGELKSFRCHVVAGRRNDRQSRQLIRIGRYRAACTVPPVHSPWTPPPWRGRARRPPGYTSSQNQVDRNAPRLRLIVGAPGRGALKIGAPGWW
jgi:hypothetical protein